MKSLALQEEFKVVKLDEGEFKRSPETLAEGALSAVDKFTRDRGIRFTSEDFMLYMRKRHLEDALKQYRAAKSALAEQVDFAHRRLTRIEKKTMTDEIQEAVERDVLAAGL
jgi:hypothetical protein